ncbi:MAG: mechanosensitive ion channel protein MscS [Candidatus Omnitrophica bacterium CG1_02_49_10]|nr:MAG: mechanosensitive ion channel protein MscS [Candidatus Omnitrophica bacterium CG1_02_49_10]
MQDIVIFGRNVPALIYAPVIYFIWVSLLLVLKKVIFSRIQKFAEKTTSKLDDILLGALDLPLTLLVFVSGATVLEKIAPIIGDGELTRYFVVALKATTVVAIVLFLDKLFKNLIQAYSHKIEILKTSGGMAQGIVRAVVMGLGLLILLDSFGVSITPILASLGIGSLAVALALQSTLENFFSGIQIIADKPIKVGHFIKLDSGEEGYVTKIGWRSSWIRMLPNNVVVIPNKVLVNSKVLNYYYPETEMAVLVQVGVHYDSDLKHVENVTVEVAREIMKEVQGGVPAFEPFIRYHTFADFSINFTVILRAKEFVDNYLIKHEFIKRLHERYRKEGIVIPYPIRAVNYAQERKR